MGGDLGVVVGGWPEVAQGPSLHIGVRWYLFPR